MSKNDEALVRKSDAKRWWRPWRNGAKVVEQARGFTSAVAADFGRPNLAKFIAGLKGDPLFGEFVIQHERFAEAFRVLQETHGALIFTVDPNTSEEFRRRHTWQGTLYHRARVSSTLVQSLQRQATQLMNVAQRLIGSRQQWRTTWFHAQGYKNGIDRVARELADRVSDEFSIDTQPAHPCRARPEVWPAEDYDVRVDDVMTQARHLEALLRRVVDSGGPSAEDDGAFESSAAAE